MELIKTDAFTEMSQDEMENLDGGLIGQIIVGGIIVIGGIILFPEKVH